MRTTTRTRSSGPAPGAEAAAARPAGAGPGDGVRPVPVNVSGWAIAAGYLALFSVLCLPAPAALFCGIMAVREIGRKPKLHGLGRAWFGIVVGGLFTALTVGVLVYGVVQDSRR